MEVLILATSGKDYAARRQGCQDSWLKDLPSSDIQPLKDLPRAQFFFVLGGNHGITDILGNCLRLPVDERYNYLPARTQAMCMWALGWEGWDYIFKCDDDTYVCLPRLLEFASNLQGEHYIGNECWVPPKGYASGGAGYFLSRYAAEIIARDMRIPCGAEDLMVGHYLREKGVPLTLCTSFIPFGKDGPWPAPDNNLITSHYITPSTMVQIYKALNPHD